MAQLLLVYHGPLRFATFWGLCHLLSQRCTLVVRLSCNYIALASSSSYQNSKSQHSSWGSTCQQLRVSKHFCSDSLWHLRRDTRWFQLQLHIILDWQAKGAAWPACWWRWSSLVSVDFVWSNMALHFGCGDSVLLCKIHLQNLSFRQRMVILPKSTSHQQVNVDL